MKLIGRYPMLILGGIVISFESALAEVCPVFRPPMSQGGTKSSTTTNNAQGYFVPNTSAATATETPIRDLPFSIQVVLLQVIEDRNVTELGSALQTIPGIIPLGRLR